MSGRWYHAQMSREQAEDMLCRIHHDGAFLVRRRLDVSNNAHENDTSQFAISFRYRSHPSQWPHRNDMLAPVTTPTANE